MAAFSSDRSDEMVKGVTPENLSTRTPDEEINDVYELRRCRNWIVSNNFKQVALQFPDELLCDSVAIIEHLSGDLEANLFILGDTYYGSCCVDEVAAEHNGADAIIHFGQACLSPTTRLPVLYVFGQWELDINDCMQCLVSKVSPGNCPVLVVYDLRYHHCIDDLVDKLSVHFDELVVARPDIKSAEEKNTNRETEPNSVRMLGRTCQLRDGRTLADHTVLFIGPEGRTLTNWMMNLNFCTFFSYDAHTRSAKQQSSSNRQVRRRLYLVERAKDASIVGILAGTLAVANYLDIIQQLRDVIRRAGKRSYTFVVGKLNAAKLANFMEVDLYVLVSCPENALIDSSDFYRPVVTPYEMELACNQGRELTGDYLTDYSRLLPGADMYVEPPAEDLMEAEVSLVTGGVRRMARDLEEDNAAMTDGQLVEQRPLTVSTIPSAGDRLAERSWQGLEQKLGQTPVTEAVEGRTGIAMGYKEEPTP